MGSVPVPLSCRPEPRSQQQLLPFRTSLQSCYCFPQVTNATGLGQPSCFLAHQMRRVLCFNCHICCLEGGSDCRLFWVTFPLELHANGPAKGCDWSGKVISVCLDGCLHKGGKFRQGAQGWGTAEEKGHLVYTLQSTRPCLQVAALFASGLLLILPQPGVTLGLRLLAAAPPGCLFPSEQALFELIQYILQSP